MSFSSPQLLTAHWLQSQSLLRVGPYTQKAPSGLFWGFIDAFPDIPDNLVSISGTGIDRGDGRIQETGEQIVHPALQVRVRSKDHSAAYERATEIHHALSQAKKVTMLATDYPNVLTSDYYIANFSAKSTPRFIGLGKDDQRPSFVFDLFLTLRKLN